MKPCGLRSPDRTLKNLALFLATALIVPMARAQAPQMSLPEFEAATIKKSDPANLRQGLGFQPGGRFVATGVTARLLIAAAYGTPQPLPPFLVLGGPDWVDKDRFDLVAKAGGDPAMGPNGPPPILFQMIQTLLAQRFALKAHRETRDLPIYELRVVNGKPRAGLKPSTFDCSQLMSAARGGAPPPVGPDGNPVFCGLRLSPAGMQGGSASMDILANSLSRGVNRPVRNQTGLTGNFDFQLQFSTESMQLPPGAQKPDVPQSGSDGPSIFTALQEQLGLKLESTRGPVEVLVVDGIDRPTEN